MKYTGCEEINLTEREEGLIRRCFREKVATSFFFFFLGFENIFELKRYCNVNGFWKKRDVRIINLKFIYK